MNYIQLINSYWQLREQRLITASEGDLYLYLIHTSNKLDWKNPFNQSNAFVCAVLGISEPTLIRQRNLLKQAGLIDFKSGKTIRKNTEYYLNNLSNPVSSPISNDVSNPVRQHKTKQNKTNNTPLPPTGDVVSDEIISEVQKQKIPKEKSCAKKESTLVPPFHSQRFSEVWSVLSTMPKWKRKPAHALQLALNQLGKYTESFAVEQMERAIAGAWQGVVFCSTDDDFRKWQQKKSTNEPTQIFIGNQDYGSSTI